MESSASRRRGIPEDVAELRELINRQRDQLGDAATFIRVDIAFHVRIAQLSGNPNFLRRQPGDARVAVPLPFGSADGPAHEETTLAEHAAIADTIEARDGERAARAMEAHLSRSNTFYKHHR